MPLFIETDAAPWWAVGWPMNMGFKVGDLITLKGQIFPGQWEFLIAGIYDGKE